MRSTCIYIYYIHIYTQDYLSDSEIVERDRGNEKFMNLSDSGFTKSMVCKQ